jgi:TonB family protein
MHTRTLHTPILFSILAATFVTLAISNPASAAPRITYGSLIPATPINVVDTTASVGTCPIADANARVAEPYPVQWLKLIAAQTNHSTAEVLLDLDSVGNLMQARVVKSSGNTLLDEQALAAARGSKYAPEVRNCNSFKRSYFLDITFDNPTAVVPAAPAGDGRRFTQ